MPYKKVFIEFWKMVKESVLKGTFAKLTMAKTVGKPNLRNIFLRPVYSEDGFKVLLKLRYRDRDTEDKEDDYSLEEALEVLKPYLKKSFSNVILFTTEKDITFKINKKGAGSIIENLPTFRDVTQAEPGDKYNS